MMVDQQSVLAQAEKTYAQLLEVYPNDPRFLRKYGEILSKQGKLAQAEQAYRKLHALLLASGQAEEARELEKRFPSLAGEGEANQTPAEAGFLSFLDTGLINQLVMRLKQRRLKEGEYLFHYGEPGESMYIVLEGELAAMLPRKDEKPVMLNLLRRGDIVGEMAMLRGSARSADVVAVKDCKLFELDRKHLMALLARHGEAEASILEEVGIRHRVTQISRNRLLAKLPLKERRRLAEGAERMRFLPQHLLAEGGGLIRGVELVTKGVADVVFEDHRGRSHWLHDLQAGDLIGETLLLDESAVYPADIVAETEVEVLSLPIDVLKDCLGAYPWMRLRLEELAATDMSKTMAMIERIRKLRED